MRNRRGTRGRKVRRRRGAVTRQKSKNRKYNSYRMARGGIRL